MKSLSYKRIINHKNTWQRWAQLNTIIVWQLQPDR